MAHLVIEKLIVKPTRIVCDVRVRQGEGVDDAAADSRIINPVPLTHTQTTPQLISAVLEYYPTLLHHACVNDEGDTFAAVADHTSLPHLLEHLVIAMQVEAEAESMNVSSASTTFVGTTEWTDLRTNRARVEVNYRDDLVALRAFCEASALINRLLDELER